MVMFLRQFYNVFELSIALIAKFFFILVMVPIVTPAALIIGLLGAGVGELYIHAQLAVKREMSNAKR